MYFFEVFRFVDPAQCADECSLILSTQENCLDGSYEELEPAIEIVQDMFPELYFEEQATCSYCMCTPTGEYPNSEQLKQIEQKLIESKMFKPLNIED